MKPRFRIFFLLALCFTLTLSGCSVLEKQKLPYQRQDEASLWFASLNGLSASEQGKRASAVWNDKNAPAAVRDRALSVIASRPGTQGTAARNELSRIYSALPISQRGAWEALFWNDLASADKNFLRELSSKVSAEQEKKFPWNLVMLRASRLGLAPESPAVLERLSDPLLYAAPSFLGVAPAKTAADGPVYAVLVLPQSGSASALGKQIAAGALAAADALKARGRQVDIRIIDSSITGWDQRLQSLPSQFALVGGPLLPNQLGSVEKASSGRAVFAFTATMPEDKEGVAAWRFFTSQQDQVRTLLDAAEEMDIKKFGIFSPEDSYSKRMAALFEKEAISRGCTVISGSYTASDMTAWPKEAGAFVQMEVGEQRGSIPVATADFDGIFLPDSWKNMDMLVSSLHYNGAQNKLMMGTSIWEQSLGTNSRNNAATFQLTIFPGAWNNSSKESAAEMFCTALSSRGAKADDWSVLGFDFVQTAAALNVQPGWTPAELNRRLSSLKVSWAGAPFRWDASGKAERKLFLLKPAAVGTVPADLEHMRARINEQVAPAAPAAPQTPVSFDQLINSITKN